MYIYIDIVILLNLCVNSLILFFTAWVLDIPYKKSRLCLAVLLTVLYVVLTLCWPVPMVYHPVTKFLFSVLILRIAFAQKSWNQIFLTLGTFYLISFLLGGAVIGYSLFVQNLDCRGLFTGAALQFNLWLVVPGILLGSLLLYFFLKPMLQKKLRAGYLYQVELFYAEQGVLLTGLFDSGNHLYSLGSGKPVILADLAAVEPLFSTEVRRYLAKTPSDDWIGNLTECADEAWKQRTALISYRGVGSADFLLGCRVDRARIVQPDGRWQEYTCVIGLYPGRLSTDQSYCALLHASMGAAGASA